VEPVRRIFVESEHGSFPSNPSLDFLVFERPLMDIFATQDMALVLNGARRLGADLAFIQLMQYYGSPENANPNHPSRLAPKARTSPSRRTRA
jgi:hypothetical protein